jgi:Mrp family chromosome partitioning ATPase
MVDIHTTPGDERSGIQQPTLLGSIRRYWWLVLLITAAFGALGLVFNASQGTSYQAISDLIVTDPRAANPFAFGGNVAPSNQASERYLADQVEILRSSQAAAVASELLEGDFSERQVLRRRSVSGDLTSNRITISFDAESAEAAKRGSDAVADAYVEIRRRSVRDSADAALRKVDTLLAVLKLTIDNLGQRIGILNSGDENRRELEQQLEAARTKLNDLRDQRDAAPLGSETRASLNAQIDELLRDFQAWEIVLRVDQPDAELTALIVEQDAAVAEHAALTTRRNSLAVDAEVVGEGVALFSPAPLPENPSGLPLDLILVASAALGLALATALAYGLSLRRTSVADKKQPEPLLDAPMLGEIPALQHEQLESGLPIVEQPGSPAAESFRFVAGAISSQQGRVSAAGEEPVRVLAVASAVADDGRAMVTANTVIAFAQEGHRVLVIDADFDRQGVTSVLAPGRRPAVGLTELFERGLKPMDVIVRIDEVGGRDILLGDRGSVDLIARGGSEAAAPFLFKQSAVPLLVEELAAGYDLVVIDSPPLLEVAYSRSVIDLTDATVAVVAHGQSTRTVRELGEQLDLAAAPVVGYVYNRSNISFGGVRAAK